MQKRSGWGSTSLCLKVGIASAPQSRPGFGRRELRLGRFQLFCLGHKGYIPQASLLKTVRSHLGSTGATNPPIPLWGHQAWEIVPPPDSLRCGPTSTILHGGALIKWESGRQSFSGPRTLANSMWMCHRYSKIVTRISSTHFNCRQNGMCARSLGKLQPLVALPGVSGTST